MKPKPSNPPIDKRHSGAKESKRFVSEDIRGPGANITSVEVPVEFHIYNWTPRPNGEGPCEQVHLVMEMPDHPEIRFAMRLKSAAAVDDFIDQLIAHKLAVWPPAQ